MKPSNAIIEEKEVLRHTSKAMLIDAIDNQIREVKLEFISKWERNHSHSDEECNAQIKALESKKEEINQLFEKIDSTTEKIDVVFSVSKQNDKKRKHVEYSA